MTPQHELIAQGVAGHLLRQAARVLQHANDPAAATIKLAIARTLPVISPDAPGGNIDEAAFFGALGQAHGEDFASAVRDGDPSAQQAAAPQSSTDVTTLQQQVAELQRQLAQVLDQQNAGTSQQGQG